MLDLTMCPGDGCPLRTGCYRARAVPSARQDWLTRLPYDPATARCDLFYDLASLAPTEATIRDRAYYVYLAAGRPQGQADAHWRQAEAELTAAFQALVTS
jgi:hypothetical protein